MKTRPRSAVLAIAIALITVACGGSTSEAPVISATDLAGRVEAGNAPLILDVRSTEEFAAGHIPGALNIPYDELPDRLDELPIGMDDEVVVHCQSGRRAGIAEGALGEAGFTNVLDLEGHWAAWQSEGLPTER